MSYGIEFIRNVLALARETVESEPTCDECWAEVDLYAELTLAGMNPDEAVPLVHEHLKRCPECVDEFTALLASLRATAKTSLFRSRNAG